MKGKLYSFLNNALSAGPVAMFFCLVYLFIIQLSTRSMTFDNTWLWALLTVMATICTVFSLLCILLRFLVYYLSYTRTNSSFPHDTALKSFIREPYHNVMERASDVAMTACAVIALVSAIVLFTGVMTC